MVMTRAIHIIYKYKPSAKNFTLVDDKNKHNYT